VPAGLSPSVTGRGGGGKGHEPAGQGINIDAGGRVRPPIRHTRGTGAGTDPERTDEGRAGMAGGLTIDGEIRKPVVFVISDSIGETAEQVVRAAASQFDGGQIEVRRVPYVDTPETLEAIVEQAVQEKAIIVYTLIYPALRRQLQEVAGRAGIPSVDIMGPTMEALQRVMISRPRLQPGLVRQLDEEYFERVEAVEFAVKYDDGRDPRGILRADGVLIGVSRTSKTPVSMYLAHRRWKVANVPLVPEIEPPQELFRLPRGKVIGLTVRPEKLLTVRQERLRAIGLPPDADYASAERIRQELAFARDLFIRLDCPVADVTNKAVEETATTVIELLKQARAREQG